MKVSEILEIIEILKKENKKENNELIIFYQNKIKQVFNNAISKAFNS